MKKLFVMMLTVCVVLSAGCGSKQGTEPAEEKTTAPETTEESESAEDAVTIGFANLDESNPFCVSVRQNMEEAVTAKGWKIVVVDNQSDPQKIIENADLMVTQKVDYFVDFIVLDAVQDAVKEKMAEADIPLMTIDGSPQEGIPYFGVDNPGEGTLTGQGLAKKVHEAWGGQIDLVILVELPGAGESVAARTEKIVDGLRETIDVSDDIIIRVDGNNTTEDAQQVVADTLTANPDKKHIVIGCLNDPNGLGALNAVQAANREDEVIIGSNGCESIFVENIYTDPESCWVGSTASFPETYGDNIVELIEQVLNGEEIPMENYPKHVFISKDNVAEYYDNPN